MQPTEIRVQDRIKFQSRNSRDQNLYVGTVEAICRYTVAQTIDRDLIPYHTQVAKEYPDLLPIEEQDFVILRCVQDNVSKTIVIAFEWILSSSLEQVPLTTTQDVRFYGKTDAQMPDIVNFLKSHGYQVSWIQK